MANNDELYALVEMQRIADTHIMVMKDVVRTYLTRHRAEEDLALMEQALPDHRFEVRPVDYIDA